MQDSNHYIRINVDDSQHRKIRLAAAINGQSMSRYMQTEVLYAADKATAGIDVPSLTTMNGTGDAHNE